MKSHHPHIFLCAIALALLLAGCGAAQNSVTTQTPLSTITTVPATSSPTPIPTADPLPSDIVVYPGAHLVVAQRITTGTLYFYRSTAAIDRVTMFYMDQMPKQGWAQGSAELNGAQGNYLVYIKDTRSVTLNIVSDPITSAQTDISVTLSEN